MATYKMIQDIEAEDKILGPLSLKQFIFALIAAFLLYINFLLLTKHVAFLMILFLPPALFAGFFAFPFKRDQPTEVWALARVRFLFKPRRRIWDQSGIKELVTITVPKRIERNLTNGLTQTEVKSRLSALANTIDSRGWAVKGANLNDYASPGLSATDSSDRLINVASLPREVPDSDVQASDDIMDARNNPIAHQFEQLIEQSAQTHHQQLMAQMNAAPGTQTSGATSASGAATDYWFLGQNSSQANTRGNVHEPVQPAVISPVLPAAAASDDASEDAFIAKLHAEAAQQREVTANMHTLQPRALDGRQTVVAGPVVADQAPIEAVQAPADPAILSLARNNDLNIATLAREAQKSKPIDEATNGEVVISLR